MYVALHLYAINIWCFNTFHSKVKLVWFSFFAFRFSFFGFRFSFFAFRFRYSNWVGKSYFDIQNPILTFELSRKIVFWHSKSYFDIRTESENRILTFKILFWQSNWVGKSYFDIQNPILTFELSRKILLCCVGVYCFHVVRPSIRPFVRPFVRPSVTLCFFSNILKTQWWIFINFCRHTDINTVHPHKKK